MEYDLELSGWIQVHTGQVVDQVKPTTVNFEGDGVRQVIGPFPEVTIATDCVDRGDIPEPGQDIRGADIPDVENVVYAFQGLYGGFAEQPVGVGDNPNPDLSVWAGSLI